MCAEKICLSKINCDSKTLFQFKIKRMNIDVSSILIHEISLIFVQIRFFFVCYSEFHKHEVIVFARELKEVFLDYYQ